jgi:hypothetical protein
VVGEKLGVAAVMELKTAGEEVSRNEKRSRSGRVAFLDHRCAVRPNLYGIGRERSIREDSSISCISPSLSVEHHIIVHLLENTESFFSVFGYPQHVVASGIAQAMHFPMASEQPKMNGRSKRITKLVECIASLKQLKELAMTHSDAAATPE